MKKRKSIFVRILIFCIVLVFMMEIGESIWGVDKENTLLAPDWFTFLLLILCFSAAYFIPLLFSLARSHNRKRKFQKQYDNLSEAEKWKLEKQPTPVEPIMPDVTELEIISAEQFVLESGYASTSMLQRKFCYNYSKAVAIIDALEIRGVIGPYEGVLERKITKPNYAKNGLREVDKMEGHDFEYWCADLLRKNGFYDVEVTQGSGDQGVDVIAKKDGVSYAIQCKCYSHDIGNKPVQEVYAGKEMYGCQVAAVMTNRYFTAGGKDLAEKTRVLLWDRDKLIEMLGG